MRAPSTLLGEEPEPGRLDIPYPRLIETPDPYEAKVRTQDFLQTVHRMTVLDRERPFHAQVQYRSLGSLGLMSQVYGPAVEICCSPPIPLVCVNFVAGGRMLIDDGGHAGVADPRHAAAFCFHDELSMRWTSGMRQLMLTIDKGRLERHLQTLLQEPIRHPLHFRSSIDLAGGGHGIAAAVLSLRRAFERCGKAGPPPVLAAEIEHSILTALLLGQPHNYTDAIFAPQPLPSPRVVRRVVELVDATPEQPFTVAVLALYAGVSERSLHSAFRRQLGTSPMSYVRRRRLELARDALLRGDPSTDVKVTDVALRFGFAHTGRFAAAYRRRFGESPSSTLRR